MNQDKTINILKDMNLKMETVCRTILSVDTKVTGTIVNTRFPQIYPAFLWANGIKHQVFNYFLNDETNEAKKERYLRQARCK